MTTQPRNVWLRLGLQYLAILLTVIAVSAALGGLLGPVEVLIVLVIAVVVAVLLTRRAIRDSKGPLT